jgi:hypothetical protein
MPIYIAKNLIDAYRARAKFRPIHELSGRGGYVDLTESISDRIIANLDLQQDDILVDVGCGDGTLLHKASLTGGISPWVGRLVGILPTQEEVSRVQQYFLENKYATGASIIVGLSQSTGLPDSFATKLVLNGVLLLLDDENQVDISIAEIFRITKKGAIVFIGELPDGDETITNSPYTVNSRDHLSKRVVKVFRNFGIAELCRRFFKRIQLTFSKKVIIVSPKAPFWISPIKFVAKLESHGFILIKYYKCEFYNGSNKGDLMGCSRWNYIAVKK